MKEIRFENISKSYGNTKIVNKLDLLIKAGDRNIAMVFQNYALYPHLTVWDNIIFGLKMNGINKNEIEKRTIEVIRILNLEGLEKRYPKELSGGQRQRVALGRATVKKSDFFLLDEPLSNLDVQLRNSSREELVKLHEISRPTFVYVTHDQIEAMTIGHRIAVLNKGDLQQIGTPEEIYNNPANIFVAKFIGTPPMNVIKRKVEVGKIYIGENIIINNVDIDSKLGNKNFIYLGIRPEHILIHNENNFGRIQGEIIKIENYGNQKCVSVSIGDENIKVSIKNEQDIKKNQKVYLEIDIDKCSYFDVETKKNIKLEDKI